MIKNLAVKAGDVMFVEVWNDTPTVGHAFVVNSSTQQTASIAFTAPPNYKLIGDSMEWIVERPTVNGVFSTLANYTACPFEYASGTNYTPPGLHPGMAQAQFNGTIYKLTMIDDAGHNISVCDLMGVQSLWFLVAGSAL